MLLYFGMLVLSTNKVVAERYLPAEIWDVTVANDLSEDKYLVIQNTETISINLADVVLRNFHAQIAGRNTPEKLAYHSTRGIMNIFSLSNTKIQFRHLQNTGHPLDTMERIMVTLHFF